MITVAIIILAVLIFVISLSSETAKIRKSSFLPVPTKTRLRKKRWIYKDGKKRPDSLAVI